jgi:hypothetical protein
MTNIEIMVHDGIIGNKATLLALSGFATGNLNAKLKQGAKSFGISDILPSTHEYIIPPLTEEEQKAQAKESLLRFMAQAPGAERMFSGT